MMASLDMDLDVDKASLHVVDAHLSAVEDGSAIRPMHQALHGQVLARMFDDG